MPSKHFIKAYFTSFNNDPLAMESSEPSTNDDTNDDSRSSLEKVTQACKNGAYDDVIPICTQEIESIGNKDTPIKMQLHLLRGTFYIFIGQHDSAMSDLEIVINSPVSSTAVKVNALINRASLFMQLENHEKCFEDYKLAIELDPDCSDIYHHRGQVKFTNFFSFTFSN